MENRFSKNSSLLVSKYALIVWGGLALASFAAGYALLGGLFVFLLLLSAFVRYWAYKAMEGLSLTITCRPQQLFPGMETELTYSLSNDKFLPLVWTELSQQAPENNCLIPDDSFEKYSYLKDEGENVQRIDAYKRSLSLLMGYESVRHSSNWRAERRGIYRPGELLLRSGDGFGLTQVEKHCDPELVPEIVVYPKRVPVDGEILLRQDWDSAYGALGFKEDMSVLRGLRSYSGTDSWKRINWRMAARQPGELQVNFYETVQPSSALFIIDGESYCNAPDALERDLETVSSLIEWLRSKGVSCGLCLPKSRRFPALCISPAQQPGVAELMYYLAGYDCLAQPVLDKENRPSGKFYPSAFEFSALASAAMETGTIALFTHDPSALSAKLFERLERSRLMVFSSGTLECADKEIRLFPVSSLRKEGGA